MVIDNYQSIGPRHALACGANLNLLLFASVTRWHIGPPPPQVMRNKSTAQIEPPPVDERTSWLMPDEARSFGEAKVGCFGALRRVFEVLIIGTFFCTYIRLF